MSNNRAAALALVLFGTLAAGLSSCTASSHGVGALPATASNQGAATLSGRAEPRPRPPAGSRLTVHASASVVHAGITYTQSFRGRSAFATNQDGKTFTGRFNAHGAAKLILPPGRYKLTTSVGGVCNNAHVTVPAPRSQITLICGLP